MAESDPVLIAPARSPEEVALELMKFIAEATGYAKGASTTGFAGKGGRNPEEQAEALLELYQRCRAAVSAK